MSQIGFDTLQASKDLRKHGFSAEQAEALAAMQHKALEGLRSAGDLATKTDLERCKLDILKWVFAMLLAFSSAIVALLK